MKHKNSHFQKLLACFRTHQSLEVRTNLFCWIITHMWGNYYAKVKFHSCHLQLGKHHGCPKTMIANSMFLHLQSCYVQPMYLGKVPWFGSIFTFLCKICYLVATTRLTHECHTFPFLKNTKVEALVFLLWWLKLL